MSLTFLCYTMNHLVIYAVTYWVKEVISSIIIIYHLNNCNIKVCMLLYRLSSINVSKSFISKSVWSEGSALGNKCCFYFRWPLRDQKHKANSSQRNAN